MTKPEIFLRKWKKGFAHFVPFVITIVAILLTDLLVGVLVGIVAGSAFVLVSNFKSAIVYVQSGENHLIKFKKDLSFMHKAELRRVFLQVPDGASVLLDASKVEFVDYDNAEIINDFIDNAALRGVEVILKRNEQQATDIIKDPVLPA